MEDLEPIDYRLEAVEIAIANGWQLIPLRGKVPTLKNWPALPPASPEQLRKWARAGNVGLRTGTIYVIDQDRGGDVTPLNLPDTLQVETGSGGIHYYFSTTLKLGNTAGRLGKKIDTRGIGGQVVYPGSVHPMTGRMYRWANNLPVAELPAHIVAMLTARPAPVPGNAYARVAFEREVAAVITAPPKTHNDTLNVASFNLGQLVGGGQLEEDAVRTALLRAARCPEPEALATINSGLTAGMAQPRRPPGRPRIHPERPHVPHQPAPDDTRPSVMVPGPYETDDGVYGEVGNHDFVRAVLEAIPESDIYVRGGVVGELVGPPGEIAFRPIIARRLQAIVDANIRLTQWTRARGKNALPEQKYISCTRDLAETVLANVLSFGRYRRLEMLVNYPVCLPGFKLASPGWNADAGIYYDRCIDITPITDENVIRETLTDLVVDFPFDSESSRQNFYGLLLTPILRPALNGNAPFHLVESTIERAGKGKLIEQVLGRIVCGKPIASRQYQDNETDREKNIVAMLMTGTTVIHFDNLAGFIDSQSMASLVTASSYAGRILGQSATTGDIPVTFTIIGSGNNVRMSSELVKRTIPIMLRPDTDHPEYRTNFKHTNLHDYLDAIRPKALGCLLGMIQNWFANGAVPLDEMPLGGFEGWVGAVGGVLWTAGFTQWRRDTDSWRADADTEGEDLRLLVEAWSSSDSEFLTTTDVYNIAENLDLFTHLITGKTASVNVQKFGIRVLKKYEGRPVSGYKIKRFFGVRRGQWCLKPIEHT